MDIDNMTPEECSLVLVRLSLKLAQKMFAAYNEQGPNPWKTFDGRDVPKWDELNDQVRLKWVAAADTAIKVISDAF